MTAVWATPMAPSEKLVLLALADWSGPDGDCWPSIAKLSEKSGLSERSVQGIIKSLVESGHLSRFENPGKGVRYRVHPQAEQRPDVAEVHYVYRVEAETGEFYIGARTCIGPVEQDSYLGSGNWVKRCVQEGVPLSKSILEVCESRELLGHVELAHVAPVYGSPLCKNDKLPTPGTLSKVGFRGQITPADAAPRRICAPQNPANTPAESAPNTVRDTPRESDSGREREGDHVDLIVDTWNDMAANAGLPRIAKLTPERRRKVAARLKDHGVDAFTEAIAKVGRSPFCTGSTGWRASFDFLLQPSSFVKVLEGTYDDRPRTAQSAGYANGGAPREDGFAAHIGRSVEKARRGEIWFGDD